MSTTATTTLSSPERATVPELTSIGRLSATLQRDPKSIAKAAKATGVRPALILNGVHHYDSAGVAAIARWFREHAAD